MLNHTAITTHDTKQSGATGNSAELQLICCMGTGPGDPDDVLAQHASFCCENKDTTRIREAQICQSDWGGGYAGLSKSFRISSTSISFS